MNRSRAAILKQGCRRCQWRRAHGGAQRISDAPRREEEGGGGGNKTPLFLLRRACRDPRDPNPAASVPTAVHFSTDNFASKISASPLELKRSTLSLSLSRLLSHSLPLRVCVCACAPWKLTQSPKWLVVRPPRGHVVSLLKGALELLSVYERLPKI